MATRKLGSVYTVNHSILRWVVAALIVIVVSAFALGYCGEATTAHADSEVTTPDNGVVSELCPFYPGWNLVVLEGEPVDLPSCVEVVWRYEAVEDRWYFWGRNNPVYWNDLGSFDIEKGYWLWTTKR